MRIRALLLASFVITACTEAVEVTPPIDLSMEVQAGGTPVSQAVFTFAPTPPSIRVTDADGDPVAGARVLFLPTRGRGLVVGGDVLTNVDGIASATSWRFGQLAGPQEVTAAVVSATADARVTFTATAVAGPTVALRATPASVNMQPGATRQLVVNAVDQYGNITGNNVAATFTSQDPPIATVSNTGLVTAVDYGSTVITASYLGYVANVYVAIGTHPVGTTVTSTPVASRPFGVAIAPQGTTYVGVVDAPYLTRIDLPATASSGTFPISGPAYDVAFLPGGATAYAVNVAAASVNVINRANNAVLRTIGGLHDTYRVESSVDGSYVYVTASTGVLHRINTTSDAVQTITLSANVILNGLTLSPSRNLLYASSWSAGELYEIDLATFTLVRTIQLGGRPQGIAVSPNGNTIYVANEDTGVQVLDATSLVLTQTIGTMVGAFDILLTLDGSELYVSRSQQGTVSVLSMPTLAFVRAYNGGIPRRMATSGDGLTIVVANEAGYATIIR